MPSQPTPPNVLIPQRYTAPNYIPHQLTKDQAPHPESVKGQPSTLAMHGLRKPLRNETTLPPTKALVIVRQKWDVRSPGTTQVEGKVVEIYHYLRSGIYAFQVVGLGISKKPSTVVNG